MGATPFAAQVHIPYSSVYGLCCNPPNLHDLVTLSSMDSDTHVHLHQKPSSRCEFSLFFLLIFYTSYSSVNNSPEQASVCCTFILTLMTDERQHLLLERVKMSLMPMHDILFKMSLHRHNCHET